MKIKNKHAYLVMVHKPSPVISVLFTLIDDTRNDIYLHIDAKSTKSDFDCFISQIKYSCFFLLDKRVDVRWANVTQVEAEYNLFYEAYTHGGYRYYHLLSESDLPIKSQDYLHDFFDKNDGTEFIGFAYPVPVDFYLKIRLFPKSMREDDYYKGKIRSSFLNLQKKLKFHLCTNYKLQKGANWVSITDDFVSLIIKETPYFIKKFKYSRSLDECYKQTIAYAHKQIYNRVKNVDNEYESNMRLIDWKRGQPYSFQKSDLREILNSDKLFCRKIENIDLALSILENLKNNNG